MTAQNSRISPWNINRNRFILPNLLGNSNVVCKFIFLLTLTIILPEIVTGDKVNSNEQEGVVTNIDSPLEYQQFTVKVLDGSTRIRARYQIAKIDNYFSENGPIDDE